ncbi:cache domain-containing protein [Desulfogranum marinum]|uniref:cache domain-containing protein n=1 Tax=Desulfogranum marinum TaxID=453220 RepID=UPI001965CB37|nr:cache domain-containing protein [Desulfogranum marinum]MBM9514988.1 PAS domain S-box protein [Desulfogranum marinum]
MFQTRQAIQIIAVLAIVILVAVVFNYHITRNVIEDTIVKHQQETATKAADTVEIWMSQQKKILQATVASIPLDRIGHNQQTYGPLKMAMKAGHFSDVYIGKENNGHLVDGAGWLGSLSYDPRLRPWYRHAVEKGEVSFTTPYIDLVTDALVIAMVEPLVLNDELIGVIGADTVLDTLEQNVLKLKISRHSFAFIVERGGTILVHPNREYVMRQSLFEIEKDLKNKIVEFSGDEPSSIRFKSYNDQDHIISYKRISNSSWFLCVVAPYEEAQKLAQENTMIFAIELTLRVLGFFALVGVACVLGSGMVVFILSKRYISTVQQHKNEITGITKDLKWNILKRKEVKTYYQTLFNVANDAILISKDLKIAECNLKTEEIFALPKEHLLKATLLDISPTYQPDRSLSAERIAKIVKCSQKGEQQFFRWSFLRNDGTEFPASVNLKSFTLENEEVLLLSIRDISKRVDAEAQLMQAQKMAAVGEMLGIIAHQWRQPLNTLSTYISSLQAAQYNNMVTKSFVEKLVSGADGQIKFMSKTIDDFRNFFRPSKTKGYIDVFDVIISSVKIMEAQIKNADIKLTVKNAAGVKQLTVFGYMSEFVHVLVNIIVNARDALQEKEVASSESFQKKIDILVKSDDEFVYITITDNGSGIPEDILPHIFNPYYTTKSSQSGTGVGLYMSKMIVEKEMGGQLSAQNQDGTTQFLIKLKRVQRESKQ